MKIKLQRIRRIRRCLPWRAYEACWHLDPNPYSHPFAKWFMQ